MRVNVFDYLIIGQGLAGSLAAYFLMQRNKTVFVLDHAHRGSATRVAAGLMDPFSGKKPKKTWNVEKTLPFARTFYQHLEERFSLPLFYPKPFYRFFTNKEDLTLWKKQKTSPDYSYYIGNEVNREEWIPYLHTIGGIKIQEGGILDTKALLTTLKKEIRIQGDYHQTEVHYQDIQVDSKGVSWNKKRARNVLFCEGANVSNNPYFSWAGWQHAKGEIMTIECRPADLLPRDAIVFMGKWLVPMPNGEFKFGATYIWDDRSTDISESTQFYLKEELRKRIKTPLSFPMAFETAVRPIALDMRPVIGRHPQWPCVGILNGFGSKGTLHAPYYAHQLIRHFEEHTPLDQSVDVRRFQRFMVN